MAEGDSSHYEVSIKLGSRWEIHSRWPVTQKDDALEEAKELEHSTGSMVKVSRETYDRDAGLYKEIIVYRTAGAPVGKAPGQEAPAGRRPAFEAQDDEDDMEYDEYGYLLGEVPPRRKMPSLNPRKLMPGVGKGSGKQADPYTQLGIRVLVMTVLSLLVSGGVTWILSASEAKLDALTRILDLAGPSDALFVVFLGLFIISFLALAVVLLHDYLSDDQPARKPAARRRGKPRRASAGTAPAGGGTPEEQVAEWLKERTPGDQPAPATEATPEAEAEEGPEAPPLSEEPAETAEAEAETEAEPTEEPPEAEPEPAEQPLPEDEQEEALTAGGENQRQQMLSFMKVVHDDLGEDAERLDTFNRFGVTLYLAGAVESLAKDLQLSRDEITIMLREAVEQVGLKPEHAERFAEGYESYLFNPRYMEMFETGRLAVNGFLEGDRDGARRLQPALKVWNRPKAKEAEPTGSVAVMFTDMVGSTDLNQSVGDVAAQTVVHTHNRIVRGVLADYYGREVKHTGDGIMASFHNTSNAVKAAIVIQKRVAANNKAEKDIPLHLRIGINVGEPIVENDDLFGVTVQVAARLCAAAKTDQILVSETVKALCAGKGLSFEDRGTRTLKGVSEQVHVFEPLWGEKAQQPV